MKDRHASTRFGIVVYDGVEPIDVGATVGVLSMARRLLPNLETAIVAEQRGPVRLAGGLVVLAEYGYDALPYCDILIVCGGPGWRKEVTNAATLGFLRRLDATRVASVCTGAMILAAAGVLDGRSATTRRRPVGTEEFAPLDLLNDFARDSVPRPAALVDAGVVTGGGVSLAIDATLYLIGRFYGEDARDDVARSIEYDRAFAANKAALGHIARMIGNPSRNLARSAKARMPREKVAKIAVPDTECDCRGHVDAALGFLPRMVAAPF